MKRIILIGAFCISLGVAESVLAQGTAFTYQGRLLDNGLPASGSYDVVVSLFNASSGGNQAGISLTNLALVVSEGLFTVPLDFGSASFPGADRWLEISVRTNGTGEFVTLAPRQKVTASPYSITALNLAGVLLPGALAGNYSNAVAFNNAANSFSGNGSGLTSLNASNIASGVLALGLGGTGASTPSAARANLGAAANGANSDITSLTGLTTPLPLAEGGTAASTPANAVANLGAAALAGSNSFTGSNIFTHPSNVFVGSFSGDGSSLLGLNAANFSTGLVPISRGGTGAGTVAGVRANLGVAANGANSDITSLSALSTPLSLPQGGTGGTTASNALVNLGGASLTATNNFTGVNTMTHPANFFGGSFNGDGSGLTGLNAGNISIGLLPIARGGTGSGTPAGARATLGAAASGANSDITSLSGLSTPLPVGQGGTGAGTAANAVVNLGAASLAASNVFSGVNVLSNSANSFAGTFSGDGSALVSLNAANLSSGLVPIARGGTGSGTPAGARATLGVAASGANSDITSLSGLSTPLSVGQGGTGGGTAANAVVNLGAASLTASNVFSGVNMLSNSANSFAGTFSGDGSALVSLNAANLSSGLVPIARGGTGSGTPAGARATLGVAASGANSDITSLSGLSTPLSVGQGGTGAGNAVNAVVNLGAASLAASNVFSGVNVLSNTANSFVGAFSGDGSALVSLNATGLATGLVPIIRGGTAASSPSNALANLGGASLTGSNLIGGVNFLTNAANLVVGNFYGDGSGLSNLNAASLSTGTLPNAQLAGTYAGALNLNNAANLFVGAFSGNGSAVSNVNAATLNGFSAANFWQLGGNGGTSAGANFLGTTDGQALELFSGNGVGINTNNPAGKALAINGQIGINSTNTLEFGMDIPGKQANAGKIGYQTFTPGALDIVGAGTNTVSRRIKFWAESGATFNGSGTNALVTISNVVDEPISFTLAGPFSSWRVGQNKPPDAPSAFDSFFIYQQSSAATRLLITSDGRVGINTNNPVFPLHLGNGAYCTAGGQWTSVSDRNAKQDFTAIQPKEVLAKVATLPITQWRYKVETNGVKHVGPMAQDFYSAFGLGESDRAIGTVDADGVALAAIQGLNELLKDKEREAEVFKARVQDLEQRLKFIEERLSPTSGLKEP